jgi:hypothetical protein
MERKQKVEVANGYEPWAYDEHQKWWTALYGGRPAGVVWMAAFGHWTAGFNGKPLTSFYTDKEDEPIIAQTSFPTSIEAIKAINRVVSVLGFETLPVPEGGAR